ncbi:hypothetical protein O6H91_07G124500 [Diphasiastrum complanatum]|uniref:Uncharacterized protein n=1 Tax=Diphasiastrum complanatum TaxID=34168 RepID=A0ACC2D9J0_DIPCM|nr:hypothetical protein O6H91_07G124500 [Diphasiastrum complanatum]
MFIVFGTYALTVWALGQTSECFNAFAAGQAAAFKMFKALRRTPEIDILDSGGVVLDNLKGKIEFQNVYFSYPARPEAPVLRDFSLAIPSGTSVALIGESGSGKSTIVSLVERFYDPQSGNVVLDTIDIKAMQVRWLRQQIGLVSQEPALFGGSIRDNLSVGKEAATFDEISNACQIANASSFIEKLPQGYDTHVGESGAMLSGGQRQRIAIARALLKNPRILLLDEATSALDTTSERVVQEALNRVMLNRTTIIVAHRLSTIRDANVIVVLQQGTIVEKGTHANLLQDPTSAYSQLVRLQASRPKNDQTSSFNFDRSRASPGYGGSTSVHSPSPLRSPLRSPFRSPRKWSFMNPNFGMQFSNESFSIQSFELEEQVIPSNNSTPYYFSRQQNDCERGYSIPSRVNGSLSRLAKLCRPEAPILMLAVAATAVLGAVFPVFGFVFANAISSFFETNHMKLRKTANFWAGIFVLMGVIYQVFSPIKECGFSRAGNRLIRRVCNLIFDKVLRQEIGWFDDNRNSSGAISGRLSTDVAYLQMKYSNMNTRSKVVHDEANNVAHNAISNIRTVASFCAGEHVALLYKKTSKVSIRQGIQEGIISGFGVGFSTLISYACNAVSLWYGGQLIKIHKTTFQHVFVVYYAMSMTTMLMSRCLEMIPDINKVRATFHSIFEILDYKSKIDPSETTGCTVAKSQGAIRFRHVSFAYPSRPDVQIFRNLSFSCPAGKTLALVGESGCGKSTVVSLLERFYDPDSGNIYLDNMEIKKLQLRWLRQQIGLVSQEPLLFDGTIRSNIEYGTDKECTEAEIQTAARAANAHDFIASLPDGYNTDVSERGTNLSGGQRQRIAIARAILKDPKVLLLDEATSALDAESERAVQEALDRFITNRSSIVIAHRLSSIANAHTIAVVKNGEIVEQGSHYELIKLRGAYATLANVQMLASTKK